MRHLYILSTIMLTVYGQLVIKWQVSIAGDMPGTIHEKMWFLARMVCNLWVLSSLTAAFLAFLCWVAALSHFELNYAYPFMGASFALVLILSWLFFREPLTGPRIVGTVLIVAGIIVGSQ